MRRLIVVVFAGLVVSSCSHKSKGVNGMMNIHWGMSQDSARKVMLGSPGVVLRDEHYGDPSVDYYEGAKVGSRIASLSFLRFCKKGMCVGGYGFVWGTDARRRELFDSLHAELVNEFGSPAADSVELFYSLWSIPHEGSIADTLMLTSAEKAFVYVTGGNGELVAELRKELPGQ